MSKRKWSKFALGACLAGVLGVSSANAAISYSTDFNNFVDATNNPLKNDFTQNGPQAGNAFNNNAGTGLSSSNAVDFTSNTADQTVILSAANQTLDLTDLSNGLPQVTISAYFKAQTTVTGGSAAGAFQLGLGGDKTTAFNGNPTTAGFDLNFVSARLRGDGKLQLQAGVAGTTTNSDVTNNPVISITDGNWYYLKVTVAKNATANLFDVSITLNNSDASGVIGSQLGTLSGQETNANMYNDTTTYAGFRAAGSTGNATPNIGVNLVDNFSASSAVPEPTSMAFLGLAGVGMLARRRR